MKKYRILTLLLLLIVLITITITSFAQEKKECPAQFYDDEDGTCLCFVDLPEELCPIDHICKYPALDEVGNTISEYGECYINNRGCACKPFPTAEPTPSPTPNTTNDCKTLNDSTRYDCALWSPGGCQNPITLNKVKCCCKYHPTPTPKPKPKKRPVCGNNIIEEGELCEFHIYPDSSKGCPPDKPFCFECIFCSKNEHCGNGEIETGKGEECDPTNHTFEDGEPNDGCEPFKECNDDCKCVPLGSNCGNGLIDPGEICDFNASPNGCPPDNPHCVWCDQECVDKPKK